MLKSQWDRFLFPGTWNLWKTGKNLLLLACPYCGEVFILLLPVEPNGHVQGKVSCPAEKCLWQDDVKLEGWDPSMEESDPGAV